MRKNKNKRAPFNPNSPKHQSDRNKRCKFVFIPTPTYAHPMWQEKNNSKLQEAGAEQKEENKTIKSENKKPSLGQRIKKFFRTKTA